LGEHRIAVVADVRSFPSSKRWPQFNQAELSASLQRELIDAAAGSRTVYMCSEGLWWRCHRRIISDNLVIRDWTVEHIMPTGKLSPHVLAPFARVVDGRIIYDGAVQKELE
jgi:uncharacterized protein (DUF488 family)